MAPCFITATPVDASRISLCSQLLSSTCRAERVRTPARGKRSIVTMSEQKKEQSLADWLYSKIMHNALWEGDQQVGYEPFFKEAMSARDEEKKKQYKEIDDKKM
eukprot:GFKZ01012555.1.p2 GENE.GFKZ01012555.1~~GFKZ01012555.1.p2  ORF type:complete len:104 (-),score=16.89 GFKZ01012555.1:853-1164(-)